MVKVLQIGLSDNKGGIESFVMNYYRRINHKEIQFDFIDIYGNMAYSEEIRRMGGKIIRVPDVHKHPVKYLITLKQVMRNYEVVHINMLSLANILPVLAAKTAKVRKIILHAHSTQALGGSRKSLDIFNKHIIKRMNLIRLACSDKAGDWMFPGLTYEVIKNAIDVARYEYNENIRNLERQSLGIGKDTFVIGNVAALMEEKNHVFLLEIFAELLKKHDNTILIIIGSGSIQSKLENYASNFGISEKVMFLGSRNDVNRLYNVFDCFVLPSIFEGAPFSLVEAQANGLKCYVSKDRISDDNNLIRTMRFIPIEFGEKAWAQIIEKENNIRAKNSGNTLRMMGLDISSQIDRLEKLYMID